MLSATGNIRLCALIVLLSSNYLVHVRIGEEVTMLSSMNIDLVICGYHSDLPWLKVDHIKALFLLCETDLLREMSLLNLKINSSVHF